MSDESPSLAGEAYLKVRERILRGELTIGQTLSRRKIAAEFGMSFLPVSEALLRLEHEGLLESRPRAGTRIRIPTLQDVTGHYAVRQALETQAARMFAARATASERADLIRLALRVDALAVQPKARQVTFITTHERLHRRVAQCARCPALLEAIERTHALASTWHCVTRSENRKRPVTSHQELARAVTTGSPARAADAMRRHIRRSMRNALKRLKPYFQLADDDKETYVRGGRLYPEPAPR